jgi:hypothetical protein
MAAMQVLWLLFVLGAATHADASPRDLARGAARLRGGARA